MDAYKRMIISDILSKDNQQFVVPIYQREYKWTPAECIRIVKDILNCGNSGKEHFIGSIVYQYTKFNMADMKLYLVDGQQRLTTIMLITKALNLIAAELKEDDDNADYVFSKTKRILYIDADDKSRGFTLYPSENDRDVFNYIISSKKYDDVVNNTMIPKENYMLNNFTEAYSMLKKAIENGSDIKTSIYAGFLNLSVVEIIVDKDENAQVIFESINSLGVKLNNSELIQNYLLMSNENQEQLYIKYWKPMKNNLIGEKNMDIFVKHYLHMKLEYQINDDDIYKEYLKFAENYEIDGEIDREQLIEDLYKVAEIYEPFIKETPHYSDTTNKLMKEIRDMDQSTTYPFLMRVFLDYKAGVIDEKVLNKSINLIIVYVVRRLVCGVASGSMRSLMLNLYKRIFKVKENYNRYYESIYAFLNGLRTNDYLRTETETLEALVTFPLYRNNKLAAYLLNRIENGRYPNPYTEFVLSDKLSIEHIMPQTLTDDWIAMLGTEVADDVHRKYLNTLGNLSLSSRSKNSSMSNESFETKKEILIKENSKYVELNKGLEDIEVFNEDEILKREKRLAIIFSDKYSLPKVDIEGIKFDDTIEIICDGEVNPIYQGSEIISYKLLGKETPVTGFSQLIVSVAKQLYSNYPEVIRDLAAKHFNPWNSDSYDCIHYCYGENDKDSVVVEDIRVHLGYNARYCVQFCEAMMAECGLECDQLSVFLKKDSIKGTSGVAKSLRENIVRQAYEELASEGILAYSYENMPKSHTNIKCQVDELTNAINYTGANCGWDYDYFPYCCYLEYSLNSHELWISIRYVHDNNKFCQFLYDNQEMLGIKVDNFNAIYWHIKKYPLDYKRILDSEKPVEEMKSQLIPCVEDIKVLASKIAENYVPDTDNETSTRVANFQFSLCGIDIGEYIEYCDNPSIVAKVVDDKHVEYEGEVYSLTGLAKKLKNTSSAIAGPQFFKYNGQWLNDLRKFD